MKLIELNDDIKGKNIIHVTRFIVFLTYIYRLWIVAEMQYGAVGDFGGVYSLPLYYIITPLIPFLFYLASCALSYGTFSISKYCPANSESICKVNRYTYYINLSIVSAIGNIIMGTLNFVAYYYSLSITMIIVIMPLAVGILMVGLFIGILVMHTGKQNIRQLLVSMSFPSCILLALMR